MNRKEIFELHVSQSENVRYLKRSLNQLNLRINEAIKRSDPFQLDLYTKLLALAYSAWSEAQFTQIVHTPDGLMYTEIKKVLKAKDENGISAGWQRMISLAINKVGKLEGNKDLRKRLANIQAMVKSQIQEPSILRNKLAHGQWINALNSKGTLLNAELTSKLANLDPVLIAKNIEIHTYFGKIVRDLMQSPRLGFHKNYWNHIVSLETFLSETEKWDLVSKRTRLAKKQSARPIPKQ